MMPIDDLSDDDSIEELRALESKFPPIIRKIKSAWTETSPTTENHEHIQQRRNQRASIHGMDEFQRRIDGNSKLKETFLPEITQTQTQTQTRTRTQKLRSEIRDARKTLYNLEDIQTRLSEKTSSESSLSSEESTGSFLPSIKKR